LEQNIHFLKNGDLGFANQNTPKLTNIDQKWKWLNLIKFMSNVNVLFVMVIPFFGQKNCLILQNYIFVKKCN